MKKKNIYSVSMPVCAHVSVLVEAENEEKAEEIAAFVCHLSDAEPIDFLNEDAGIIAVDAADAQGQDVWISKYETRRVEA